MKKKNAEELFEVVRTAPTELSKQDVASIIQTIPTLPPPSGTSWFHNINLNSIIMSTTAITIITGSVMYLSSLGGGSELPGQETTETQTSSQQAELIVPDSLADQVKPLDSVQKLPELQGQLKAPDNMPSASPSSSSPSPDNQEAIAVNTNSAEEGGLEGNDEAAPTGESSDEREQLEPIQVPALAATVQKSGSQTVTKTSNAKKPFELGELQLKRLKRALLRQLAQDGIITNRKKLNVLEYKEGEIFVNNFRMNYEQFSKYSQMLNKYRIEPGPVKRVVTAERYIMVGDFIGDRFKGVAQGRGMDIKFINTQAQEKGLLSPADGSNSGLFEKGNGKGNLIGSNASPASFDLEGNSSLTMSTKKIKGLKKELYRALVDDGQISSKSEHVLMRIEPQGFQVNKNGKFGSALKKSYTKLFSKYDLKPSKDLKVMMTPDFILVGTFTNNQFSGRVQGKFNQKTLEGSILEGEIKRYAIFQNGVELESSSGSNISITGDDEIQPTSDNTQLGAAGSAPSRVFQKALYKALVTDGLIKNQRSPVIINIEPEAIAVYDQAQLNPSLQKEYTKLFTAYGIRPDINLKLLMTPKFVLIGHFRKQSFNGEVYGEMRGKDLRGSVINRFISHYDIFSTNFNYVTEGNMTLAGSALMYDNQTDAIAKKLSSEQIKGLKGSLYQALVADKLIADKADVVLRLEPGNFLVNRTLKMDKEMEVRYTRLVRQHGFHPGDFKKVAMSSNFILAGRFEPNGFSGTFQGTFRSQDIRGSFLQNELRPYESFQEKSRMVSPYGTLIHEDKSNQTVSKTEERTIAPFSKLQVSGLAVVYLSQGPHKIARVEASGIPIEDVITQSENGLLTVTTKNNNVFGESIAVYVSSPNLTAIEVGGAAEVIGQNTLVGENLKVISVDAGAANLSVDLYRLHLQMDGGDIDVEGKAIMEKVDFLPMSERGSLDQSGLNVLERWTNEGGSTWSEQDLPELRTALLSRLIDQGYISTFQNPAAVQFSNNKMTVNGHEVAPNYLDEYRTLYKTYGLPTHADSRLWIDPDFMVLAEKAGKNYELQVLGTDLELNIEGSWEALEDAILGR